MADRIYFSCWLRGFTEHNMLAHFDKLLRRFPYSKMTPGALLKVYALELVEPAALERRFEDVVDPKALIQTAREMQNADCAYLVETCWDLWEYDAGWKLAPSRVMLACFGPLFPSEMGEQIRLEVGIDGQFLPDPERECGLTPLRSNIRSLLHLASDVESALPVEKNALWSESGENLAERLKEALSAV